VSFVVRFEQVVSEKLFAREQHHKQNKKEDVSLFVSIASIVYASPSFQVEVFFLPSLLAQQSFQALKS
jgi:hypothetical protein